MPIHKHEVKSFDDLVGAIKKAESNGWPIYILFISGDQNINPDESQNKATAEDIVCLCKSLTLLDNVETVIDDFMAYLPKSRVINFIRFCVTSETWGPGSDIVIERKLRVLRVPTLLRWNGPQRLEMDEITMFPLLDLMFEEDDTNKAC